MPNIKSAKKRVLVSQTKAMQNKAAKSALKTDIKKFEAAVAEGNRSEADVAYKVAVKAVDKAAAAQEQRCQQEEQHDHQAEQAGLIFCKRKAVCIAGGFLRFSRPLPPGFIPPFCYAGSIDLRGGRPHVARTAG